MASAEPSVSDMPNILFLIADDLSTRLGCYGDRVAITPAIDQLAREGVLFERAYACGTVCTPSRKSFLTGMGVRTVGWGNNNYLIDNPDAMTMPRWFREHGYQTAKVGKVQHKDAFEGALDWDLNMNTTEVFPSGNEGKVVEKLVSDDGRQVVDVHIRRDDQPSMDESRTDAFMKFVDQQWDSSKPFFFALGFHAPHEPHEANRRHYDLYCAEEMPISVPPPGATPMTKPYPASFRRWSVEVPEAAQREAVLGYYGAVSGLDEQVGRAMDFLEERDIADNTIVVFISDQGYCLGYRDCWAKHLLYPAVLRVPLIVRDPRMKRGDIRVEGLVELLDIFPTLTEMAGLPTPGGLDGASFVPLMVDPSKRGRPATYAQGILHLGRGKAVTTETATYLEWDGGEFTEFYNLKADPDAWHNQIGNPEGAGAVNRHRLLLRGHFE
ncbi:sulfatase-like hydrolase/transferase [Pontiella desulfatans]|nr:sulfatase-like hydrolase/transferase [Pontiella desulfatans]